MCWLFGGAVPLSLDRGEREGDPMVLWCAAREHGRPAEHLGRALDAEPPEHRQTRHTSKEDLLENFLQHDDREERSTVH